MKKHVFTCWFKMQRFSRLLLCLCVGLRSFYCVCEFVSLFEHQLVAFVHGLLDYLCLIYEL
jgi:hypothetical protein